MPGRGKRQTWWQATPGGRTWALAGVAAAVAWLLLLGWSWGFMVDDAWIIARVAHHGLCGEGFRFNPGLPVTDAVTPWGFERLIAWVGAAAGARTPLELFGISRALGLFGTFVSVSGLLAHLLTERGLPAGQRGRAAVLLLGFLAVNLPVAAWAGAGLSAPWVGMLVTLGMVRLARRPTSLVGVALLGWAGAWRPELAPFVVVATLRHPPARRGVALGLVLGCLLLLPLARLLAFGSPVPLAAIAKAPDLDSGLRYSFGTLALGGPWLAVLVRRRGWRLGRPGPWGEAWPLLAHLLAVAAAGGDWMAFFRLSVPVLPWVCASAAAALAADLRRSNTCRSLIKPSLRGLFASVGSVLLLVVRGPQAGEVLHDRLSWLREAEGLIPRDASVAAVDIGWVGLATAGPVLDLAGVTDPTVARLPGGHTSKAVPASRLLNQRLDLWVVRVDPTARGAGLQPIYGVDARLLRSTSDVGWAPRGLIGNPRDIHYVVLALPSPSM